MFWKSKKSDAVVFVDYEFWYVAIKNGFDLVPDIEGWKNELAVRYPVCEIYFFADTENPYIAEELPKLRAADVALIETPPGRGYSAFILLDYLYKKAAEKKSPKNFVLFAGSGRYAAAVSSLVNDYKKQVFLYGVRGSTSSRLKALAGECRMLPGNEQIFEAVQELIIHEYDLLAQEASVGNISFSAMMRRVSEKHNLHDGIVTGTMKKMLGEGLLERKVCVEHLGAPARNVVVPMWETLIERGLYIP